MNYKQLWEQNKNVIKKGIIGITVGFVLITLLKNNHRN